MSHSPPLQICWKIKGQFFNTHVFYFWHSWAHSGSTTLNPLLIFYFPHMFLKWIPLGDQQFFLAFNFTTNFPLNHCQVHSNTNITIKHILFIVFFIEIYVKINTRHILTWKKNTSQLQEIDVNKSIIMWIHHVYFDCNLSCSFWLIC